MTALSFTVVVWSLEVSIYLQIHLVVTAGGGDGGAVIQHIAMLITVGCTYQNMNKVIYGDKEETKRTLKCLNAHLPLQRGGETHYCRVLIIFQHMHGITVPLQPCFGTKMRSQY